MADPITVLHVDDDPAFAGVVAEFLERESDRIAVETVHGADPALDCLADRNWSDGPAGDPERGGTAAEGGSDAGGAGDRIDCVVSDYQMPGPDGIEFLAAVRERDEDLPFVLFTGHGSEGVAGEAIAAGATDYLQKGGGTEQYGLLANRIENAVEQYRSRRAAERTNRRLRALAENTNDVLWMFSADWSELLFVNSAYEAVWGRPVAELEADPRSFLEGIHPEDRDRVRAAMAELSAGSSVDVEYRVNAAEDYGRVVWVQAEPIREDGEVVRVVGFARDVTERVEFERRIDYERDRLAAVFAAVPEPVVHLSFEDGDPVVVAVNDAFEAVFGYPAERVEGEHLDRVIVPDRLAEEAERINRQAAEDEVVDRRVVRKTADGEREFRLRAAPVLQTEDRVEWVGTYVPVDD